MDGTETIPKPEAETDRRCTATPAGLSARGGRAGLLVDALVAAEAGGGAGEDRVGGVRLDLRGPASLPTAQRTGLPLGVMLKGVGQRRSLL